MNPVPGTNLASDLCAARACFALNNGLAWHFRVMSLFDAQFLRQNCTELVGDDP